MRLVGWLIDKYGDCIDNHPALTLLTLLGLLAIVSLLCYYYQ